MSGTLAARSGDQPLFQPSKPPLLCSARRPRSMATLRFAQQCSNDEDFKQTVLAAPGSCLCIIDVCSKSWGPCEALYKKQQSLYHEMAECAAPNARRHPR